MFKISVLLILLSNEMIETVWTKSADGTASNMTNFVFDFLLRLISKLHL